MISVAAPAPVGGSDEAGAAVLDIRVVEGSQPGQAAVEDLLRLRSDLERLDNSLIELLSERRQLAIAVGRSKRSAGLPIVDPAQEASVLRRAGEQARAAGLAEDEVRQIFWCIIDLSRNAQRESAS